MPCPCCGHEWDLTGGGDGVYSTDHSGNVRKIRNIAAHLGSLEREQIDRLRAELASARKGEDEQAIRNVLETSGLGFLLTHANRDEVWAIAQIVVAVIFGLLALRGPDDANQTLTPTEVDQVCETVVRVVNRETTTRADGRTITNERVAVSKSSTVGRNAPCPCGSGSKFKRCHGRHPSDPLRPDGRPQ